MATPLERWWRIRQWRLRKQRSDRDGRGRNIDRLRRAVALEFDRRTDSIFQPYDRAGRRHMEYLLDRGAHADVPVAEIMAIFAREYPRLLDRGAGEPATRFREEAS